MKYLIAGASGLIGSSLVSFLEKKGDLVLKLVRRESKSQNEIFWDPENEKIDTKNLEGIDAIVNLAGESIAGLWTREKKRKILQSRLKATHFLSNLIKQGTVRPGIFISASAVGYYGDRKDECLSEHSSKGEGFLSKVCEEWEKAAFSSGIKTACLRFGIVLSPSGGVLKKMQLPFKLGLGGKLGSGTQYMSWIAIEDVVGIISYVAENGTLSGVINVVSPQPIKNQEFTTALGRSLKRPTFLNVPEWGLRLLLGEMGKSLLLSSQKVYPDVLMKSGYRFLYPDISLFFEALAYPSV